MATIEQPTRSNGHTVPTPSPRTTLGTESEPAATEQRVGDSETVAAQRARLADWQTEHTLNGQLAELDRGDIAASIRSEQERVKDKEVAEAVRAAQRREHRRAGLAEVRGRRVRRIRSRWDEKATATRDRILDPARAVGSDHRRWVASTVVLYGLLAGGVAWLTSTVHDGLVGTNGPIVGYLVEPMASLLLVVSLLAQHTARQRGEQVKPGFLAFDVGLLAASLLLNTIPWTARYGLDVASLTGHLLAPVLLAAVVVGLHLISGQYAQVITANRPTERHRAACVLLTAAVESGDIAPDTSVTKARDWVASRMPGGMAQHEARAAVRDALGR